MQVIARNPKGLLRTLHIRQTSNGKWLYCSGWRKDKKTGERRPILSPMGVTE